MMLYRVLKSYYNQYNKNMFCCFKKSIESVHDAPRFSMKGKFVRCRVVKVYDGDTITIIFPFSNAFYKHNLRLFGIDTPELRSTNIVEKTKAILARDWLKKQILGNIVWVQFENEDKYGRLLGTVYKTRKEESINSQLIQNGFAVQYNGGKKN
jgi:endonuclease YncB( thermonuclease family)